ncbi:hypothetical protein ACLKA6_017518 [Drosophila palustris]
MNRLKIKMVRVQTAPTRLRDPLQLTQHLKLIEMMRIMQHQHANMTQMQAFQMEILRMNEIQMEKTNILIEALASKPVTAARACENEFNAGSSVNTDEQETVPLSEPMQRYLGPKLYDLPEFDGSPEALAHVQGNLCDDDERVRLQREAKFDTTAKGNQGQGT